MNRNPILDPTLQEILQVIKPTRADWDTRINVLDQLRTVLQSLESLRGDQLLSCNNALNHMDILTLCFISHFQRSESI